MADMCYVGGFTSGYDDARAAFDLAQTQTWQGRGAEAYHGAHESIEALFYWPLRLAINELEDARRRLEALV